MHLILHKIYTFSITGDVPTTSNTQQTNWLQFSNVPNQYSGITTQGNNLLQATNHNSAMVATNIQQAGFQTTQVNPQPMYSTFQGSSMAPVGGQQNSYILSVPPQSECLTPAQSQLLDSFSGWGKTKTTKPPATTLSETHDLGLMAQFDSTIVQGAPGMFTGGNQDSGGIIPGLSNIKPSTVLDMLDTAESEIKGVSVTLKLCIIL